MRTKISKKVIGLFLAGGILFVLMAGGLLYVIKTFRDTIYTIEAASKKAETVRDLRFRVNRLLITVNHYLVTEDIGARDDFDVSVSEITGLLSEIRSFKGNERWIEVAALVERDAISYGEKGLDILYIEDPIGNKSGRELIGELDSIGDKLIKEAEEFHNISEDEARVTREKAFRFTGVIGVIAVAVSGILFLSIWPLYHYLRKFVTEPIRQLHEGAGIIAKGDLAHRLEVSTGDELEDLALEFNKMASSLEMAKKELDKKILELYTLYNVSKALSASFEVEELLKKIVENVSQGLKIDRVMVMLVDDRNEDLYIVSHTGFIENGLERKRFKVGEGFYGASAKAGEPKIVDIDAGASTPGTEEIFDPDIKSVITVPFGTKGKILGLLVAFKRKPEVFKREDQELLMTVSEHIALALENAMLYKETQLLAITDGLTGLYNYRFFRQRLGDEIDRGRRYGHPLSLIMIDIDNFKRYNDRHGHQMGDSVLKGIGELIKSNLRTTDFLARYGGEEFVIVLTETDKNNALSMAERIREAVCGYPFAFGETQPGGALTISLGVASFNEDAAGDEDLIKKADQAMYMAKNTGKNRVVGHA